MTNKIAVVLAVVVIAVFAIDAYSFDGAFTVIAGKKLLALIDWVAFWR